jgi:hypothetical protein
MVGSPCASCVVGFPYWPQRHEYGVGCWVPQKSEIRAKVLLGSRPSTARSPAHITLTAFIFYSRSDASSAANTQVTFTGMITSLIIHYLGWQACRRFLGHLSKMATICSCRCEMRPTEFLNPGAFPDTNWRTTTNNLPIPLSREHWISPEDNLSMARFLRLGLIRG